MMERREALRVIAEHRGHAAVITTMSAMQDWVDLLSPDGLDCYIGGAMGYASSVGLGVAIAKPARRVIVIDGDGSLLMNLGTLVTIADVAPRNLIHVVLENGMYELTGAEPTPGSYDLVGIARSCGMNTVHRFEDIGELRDGWAAVMAQSGPIFVSLRVAQGPGQELRLPPSDQLAQFEKALQSP